jgi:hypothetical protein
MRMFAGALSQGGRERRRVGAGRRVEHEDAREHHVYVEADRWGTFAVTQLPGSRSCGENMARFPATRLMRSGHCSGPAPSRARRLFAQRSTGREIDQVPAVSEKQVSAGRMWQKMRGRTRRS